MIESAAAYGLDFRHETGAAGAKHLPETMGAGVAFVDYDGDGWLDLYAVQSGPFPPPPGGSPEAADRLFRNLAGQRFADVTAAAGAGVATYGQGVTAADVEGDGDLDLYVAAYGPDTLLVNRGDGTFVEADATAGTAVEGWSSSAAFADADGDTDLDLYVTRYLVYSPDHGVFCAEEDGSPRYCDPSLFVGAADVYLVNLVDEGDATFTEATAEAGLAVEEPGRGLGVVFTDLDGDGDPDLYVANDLTLNLLFANRGDGTFEDLSLLSGAAVNREGKPEAGMGIAVGDVDGDLDPDLAVTNFDVETNTLYRNLAPGLFEDVAAASGFGVPSFNQLAFGILFADLDADGDLDAYVANGHIFERPARGNIRWRQRDQVLLGDGAGGFAEWRCPAFEARETVARGAAAGDFDHDGDIDLAVQESGGPLALLVNGADPERWLGVELHGAGANRQAIGARVVLESTAGNQARWVTAGDSYQSSSDRRALFALPDGARATAVEVAWPSGATTRVEAPPLGRYLHVTEP